MKKYRILDKLSSEECKKFNVPVDRNIVGYIKGVFAVNIYEYREPKKGEWYLSGAVSQAYKAPNDFSSKYWIAELKGV